MNAKTYSDLYYKALLAHEFAAKEVTKEDFEAGYAVGAAQSEPYQNALKEIAKVAHDRGELAAAALCNYYITILK